MTHAVSPEVLAPSVAVFPPTDALNVWVCGSSAVLVPVPPRWPALLLLPVVPETLRDAPLWLCAGVEWLCDQDDP
jgi:hypothetical protein